MKRLAMFVAAAVLFSGLAFAIEGPGPFVSHVAAVDPIDPI